MGLPSYGALGARIALRFATCFQTGILILALAFTIFPVTILYHFRLYMSIGFAKLFWQFRDNKTAPITEGGIFTYLDNAAATVASSSRVTKSLGRSMLPPTSAM